MSLKDFFKPVHLNKLLIILAAAVVLAFIFTAGVLVGQEKTKFSRDWEKNYFRNVMGPGGPGRGLMNFHEPGFNPRSGFGQIIKIEGDNLIVKGPDNIEKTILINAQTAIREFNQSLRPEDLRLDENIVVIGRPNGFGQVEARLIRVMPTAPRFNDFNNNAASGTEENQKYE